MNLLKKFFLLILVGAFCNLTAIEVNPGYPGNIDPAKKEAESPLRRGEVIFFISYPFTFLASFAAYGLAGYGMRSLESGKNDFALQGGGFYGLVAVTAAFLSFGIAMNDYYAVKAQTRNIDGTPSGYLSLSYRF